VAEQIYNYNLPGILNKADTHVKSLLKQFAAKESPFLNEETGKIGEDIFKPLRDLKPVGRLSEENSDESNEVNETKESREALQRKIMTGR